MGIGKCRCACCQKHEEPIIFDEGSIRIKLGLMPPGAVKKVECPSCAAKDDRIAELEYQVKSWRAEAEMFEESNKKLESINNERERQINKLINVALAAREFRSKHKNDEPGALHEFNVLIDAIDALNSDAVEAGP
jgi:hypothetical protein